MPKTSLGNYSLKSWTKTLSVSSAYYAAVCCYRLIERYLIFLAALSINRRINLTVLTLYSLTYLLTFLVNKLWHGHKPRRRCVHWNRPNSLGGHATAPWGVIFPASSSMQHSTNSPASLQRRGKEGDWQRAYCRGVSCFQALNNAAVLLFYCWARGLEWIPQFVPCCASIAPS